MELYLRQPQGRGHPNQQVATPRKAGLKCLVFLAVWSLSWPPFYWFKTFTF